MTDRNNAGAINLPLVRRLEAVGFRAWPATTSVYDGSWLIRLTDDHPSKRINCVTPLDPSDIKDAALRIHQAEQRFAQHGRAATFRETPLMPAALIDMLRENGWESFDESLVMSLGLTGRELPDTLDHLPTQDVILFAGGYVALEGGGPEEKQAMVRILKSIKPVRGMFLISGPDGRPQACTLCVQDNDLAGILSLAVDSGMRRSGKGTEILSAALRWARITGARTAWLQVSANNRGALALYEKFGFTETYRYRYWRKAGSI